MPEQLSPRKLCATLERAPKLGPADDVTLALTLAAAAATATAAAAAALSFTIEAPPPH